MRFASGITVFIVGFAAMVLGLNTPFETPLMIGGLVATMVGLGIADSGME